MSSRGDHPVSPISTVVGAPLKPWRKPRPILINAGSSPSGLDYTARHCDWLFVAGDPAQMPVTGAPLLS